jgi:hypothetical protein
MGGFWPMLYVVKTGHARDIYFLLQTRIFWYSSAPPLLSLRAAIYSPVPFIGCIGSSTQRDLAPQIRAPVLEPFCYGWMPHNADFGVLDLTPSILLLRQFWD